MWSEACYEKEGVEHQEHEGLGHHFVGATIGVRVASAIEKVFAQKNQNQGDQRVNQRVQGS